MTENKLTFMPADKKLPKAEEPNDPYSMAVLTFDESGAYQVRTYHYAAKKWSRDNGHRVIEWAYIPE